MYQLSARRCSVNNNDNNNGYHLLQNLSCKQLEENDAFFVFDYMKRKFRRIIYTSKINYISGQKMLSNERCLSELLGYLIV